MKFEDSLLSSQSSNSSTNSSMYTGSDISQKSTSLTSNSSAKPLNVLPTVYNSRAWAALSLNAQEFVPVKATNFRNPLIPQTGINNGSYATVVPGISERMQIPLPLNQLIMRRQQILQEKAQQILQNQQNIAAATLAQQQTVLSEAAITQSPNEIANSLKTFAYSSTFHGNESSIASPVDEVMKDFASNGYTIDDFNRYHQQQQAASYMQILASVNARANLFPRTDNLILNQLNANINIDWLQRQQQLLQDNLNTYNELYRQSVFQLLPQPYLKQAEVKNGATNCALNINVDYNSQNIRAFKKTFQKRNVPVAPTKRCVFCENNNEPQEVVKSHAVRDSKGRVLCPKLRVYVCPICKESGDYAHTVKYCPQKPITTMEDTIKASTIRYNRHLIQNFSPAQV